MRKVMKNNSKRTHLLCLTAILISFSLFTTILFESNHKGHEEHCQEENCPVCFVLQIIHNTKDFLDNAPIASVETLSFIYINFLVISALLLAPATLVKQKVKLVI